MSNNMIKEEIEQIGGIIANGAMILSYDKENSRVLCLFRGEFVVWGYFNPTSRTVEYGHYFGKNMQSALMALNRNRINKYWEDK